MEDMKNILYLDQCQDSARTFTMMLKGLKNNRDRKAVLDHIKSSVCPFCGACVDTETCFCDLDHA